MSAPERFQVGDTVRCVEGHPLLPIGPHTVTAILEDSMIEVDGRGGDGWFEDRFVLVSRPTPTALDPLVWDWGQTCQNLNRAQGSYLSNVVAWSWFCWWASTTNLAAHFLPTEAAARTRASNGRDVPAATVLVELPVDVVEWWARPTYHFYVDRNQRMAAACRRALGGGA